MQRVLCKRILRDLKANIARYTALSFLIILSMYMVVSLVGAAETIIRQSKVSDEIQNVEDGQFSLFAPMDDKDYEHFLDKGISLEKMFFLDYMVDGNKTIRVYKDRSNIDKVCLYDGNKPQNDGEIILERKYAEKK